MDIPKLVILPGTEDHLLRKELAAAFTAVGCKAHIADPDKLHDPDHTMRLVDILDGTPSLLFSINASGLPPLHRTLDICSPSNCQVAIWFVDNPWNVLSGVKDPGWRDLPLFVTDKSFIDPLKANGAKNVHHLPLAASFEHFAPNLERESAFPPPDSLAPFVFVGRSAFPGREAFFANIAMPADICKESERMLMQGERPDLIWWESRLGTRKNLLWPGREARRPACGAEESNHMWRSLCLVAAAAAGRTRNAVTGAGEPGLDIFGDLGWRTCLPPGIRLRQPVDYYARLPGIYRKTPYSLCLSSMQLPRGLNQRHFDIWAAGGFCLSDTNPGLELFPEELVRPICFKAPDHIGDVVEHIEKLGIRSSLINDWQALLKEKHSYIHRVNSILEALQ